MLDEKDIKLIKETIEDHSREPKIQWSKFSPDRSEQYVIRVNSYSELEDLRNFVLKDIPKEKPFPDDEGPVATPVENTQPKLNVPLCPVHHFEMKLRPAGISRKTGKPYDEFWSCPGKNRDGGYCNAKPPEVIK